MNASHKRKRMVITVATYSCDDKEPTKAVITLIDRRMAAKSGGDGFVDSVDVVAEKDSRLPTKAVGDAILSFIEKHGLKKNKYEVAIVSRPIGCPHEEGVDYEEGKSCPRCPYWAGRNRFTREIEN